MSFNKVLVANRGEIAVRIVRAANSLGLGATAIYSKDDSASLHIKVADDSIALPGQGVAAYQNQEKRSDA